MTPPAAACQAAAPRAQDVPSLTAPAEKPGLKQRHARTLLPGQALMGMPPCPAREKGRSISLSGHRNCKRIKSGSTRQALLLVEEKSLSVQDYTRAFQRGSQHHRSRCAGPAQIANTETSTQAENTGRNPSS